MWYQSKIAYRTQDYTGKWKTITESFLHEAISFSDVENQLAQILNGRVTDYEVKAISLIKFDGVYEPLTGGDFYKVSFLEENPEPDKKPISRQHLVAATDVNDGEKRAEEYMKRWVVSTTITGVVKSSILGVWHPYSEQWQDDFKERMARLAEEGNQSTDSNQLSLFDKSEAFGEEFEALAQATE